MIMNKASLEMLNTKLERPLTELSFRPNILVEGPEAFDEVNRWMKVFRIIPYRIIPLLLSLPFLIVHGGKFNYWNQSSNGNIIHKEDVKFPNFSQNAAYFPNSMGPGPIPKKWCESPVLIQDFEADFPRKVSLKMLN